MTRPILPPDVQRSVASDVQLSATLTESVAARAEERRLWWLAVACLGTVVALLLVSAVILSYSLGVWS